MSRGEMCRIVATGFVKRETRRCGLRWTPESRFDGQELNSKAKGKENERKVVSYRVVSQRRLKNAG